MFPTQKMKGVRALEMFEPREGEVGKGLKHVVRRIDKAVQGVQH